MWIWVVQAVSARCRTTPDAERLPFMLIGACGRSAGFTTQVGVHSPNFQCALGGLRSQQPLDQRLDVLPGLDVPVIQHSNINNLRNINNLNISGKPYRVCAARAVILNC